MSSGSTGGLTPAAAGPRFVLRASSSGAPSGGGGRGIGVPRAPVVIHHKQQPPPAPVPQQPQQQHHGHGHGHGHSHGSGGTCHAPAASQGHDHGPEPAPLSPVEELFACVKSNDLGRFDSLVAEHGPELSHGRDAQGHTLAHWAAQRSDPAFLDRLQRLGAPLDLPSDDSVRLHPIHWACTTGNLAGLRALVRLGVDINTADAAKRRTPLLIAAQNGFPLLVLYCVKHGADVSLVDIDEDSAIHWAAYKGATEIVSVFQYLGLSTDAPDRFGQTPLHLAAMRGELATVQYLVEELESDLGVTDKQGRRPVDLARLKGYERVTRYLTRRAARRQWNVFAWWESSRAPYYFVIVNLVLGLVVYARWVMPAMPEQRGLYVLHLAWNALACGLFVLTTRTSPGDLARDPTYRDEYTRVTEALVQDDGGGDDDDDARRLCLLERPLCHSCHIQRPRRAKHCRVCKTCIHTFDHHCPFVDNCIGRGNYVLFLGFVGTLTIDILLLLYVLVLQWRANVLRWWLGAIGIYVTVALVPVLNLLVFHCYLTLKNLTTNEVMNSHRYQYLRSATGEYQNPFDRGWLLNVMERCLPEHLSTTAASGASTIERHGLLRPGKGDKVLDSAALPV